MQNHGRNMRTRMGAPLLAMSLVVGAGTLDAVAFGQRQDQEPSRPGRDRDPSRATRPATGEDATKPESERILTEREQAIEAARRGRGNGTGENVGQQAGGAQSGAGGDRTVGSLIGADGMVSLNFQGPVELSAFMDYVSRALGLTIRGSNIPATNITFYAPVSIPANQLLPLTQSILEDNNLALVEDVATVDDGAVEDNEKSRIFVVRQIQQLPVGASTTRIFPTPLISPSALVSAIQQQIGNQVGATGSRYSPLDDLGVLVVTASPRTLDTIAGLIEDISNQISAQKLFTFDVQHVSAVYARERILTLVGEGVAGNVGAARPPGQAAPGVTVGNFSNMQARLFIDQGNRLLLRGTEREREMLSELVGVVDVVTPLEVRLYVVGNKAAQVASTGSGLGLGPVAEISVGATSNSSGFGRGGFGGQSGSAESSNQPTASQFVLDVDTGSFIYYGTESQHGRVSDLVEEFKKTDLGDTIEIRTYKLLYASVSGGGSGGGGVGGTGGGGGGSGVADLLRQLIESPQQNRTTSSPFLPRTGTGAGGSTGLPPEVEAFIADQQAPVDTGTDGGDSGATRLIATSENTTIVADEARNQLFIKAPRKAHDQFERIIRDLDRRQAQVVLEVQIVAVSSNTAFDFAADVQINSGQFTFLSSFGLTSAAAGGDPFEPRTLGLGNAGLTSAVIDSDFLPVAIRALQTLGKTETLSQPSILALDNREASYSSTTQVPYASTVQGNTSTVTSQGGVAEAGTSISVTPRIGAGGFVTLEDLQITLSSFTGEGADGLQPPSQVDEFSSFVTLPTDSTIVVGGFELAVETETERKVPILGDIPLVGLLFRDIGESKNSTRLFFFITPRIMNDPNASDLRLMSEGPINESEIDPDVPSLEFVSVPLRGRFPGMRDIPTNDAARSLDGLNRTQGE